MAPPQKPFPVSELEQRILTHNVNYKEKSRKLPKDFKLKDCELFELVQYSCTTMQQQLENSNNSPTGSSRVECFPFVRLFRRCQNGNNFFHVETTAWEGQHAWRPIDRPAQVQDPPASKKDVYAEYGSYFWTKK